jgi:hypothetical protein
MLANHLAGALNRSSAPPHRSPLLGLRRRGGAIR